MEEVKIENVVATATFPQEIDLLSVVEAFPSVEYRPRQFPGLVFRLKKPKTATLIFHSGKMVCTGAKSETQARKAINKVVKELKNKGVGLSKPTIKVQNIVASASLGVRVDLEKGSSSLERTMYEPEQFPGMVYRMKEPKVVILIFSTGKLVITGARREKEVYTAVSSLRQKLEEHDLIQGSA
ncbi:MAG: TATA-box-binding protein [Candidatus Bathyarchaeota archaeon]|nr:TATA-box-binding protein [Candidatus Bathyarchaeota archaeon]